MVRGWSGGLRRSTFASSGHFRGGRARAARGTDRASSPCVAPATHLPFPEEAAYRPRRVADLMARGPPSATADTTVAEAFRLLTSGGLRDLPVVDRTGRLVGVVSERDLLRWLPHPGEEGAPAAAPARAATRRVGDLVAPAPLTLAEEDPIDLAADLMAAERVTSLPVVDEEGRPLGMVSLVDVASALAAALRERGAGTTAGATRPGG